MSRLRHRVINMGDFGFWLCLTVFAIFTWLGDDGRQAVIGWIGRGCA